MPRRTRAGWSAHDSSAVGNGRVSEGNGGTGWPRRVGRFRLGVPQAPGFEEAAEDGGLVADGGAAQGVAAFWTCQGVDCVALVAAPGPVGAGGAIARGLIPGQGGGGFIIYHV